MRKMTGYFATVLLALVLAAVPAAAQDMTVKGVVVSNDGSVIVVATESGQQMTFSAGGASVVPVGVAAGSSVVVGYKVLDDGTLQAQTVTLAPSTTAATTGASDPTRTEEARTEPESSLPATASPLPTLALAGLLTFGAGLMIRRVLRPTSG